MRFQFTHPALQKSPLHGIRREFECLRIRRLRLRIPAQAAQQIRARRMEQVISIQIAPQRLDPAQPVFDISTHRNGNRPI